MIYLIATYFQQNTWINYGRNLAVAVTTATTTTTTITIAVAVAVAVAVIVIVIVIVNICITTLLLHMSGFIKTVLNEYLLEVLYGANRS